MQYAPGKYVPCLVPFFSPGILSPGAIVTVLPDSDKDGLPDRWEGAHGLNPNLAEDAPTDADGDAQLNWEECQAGANPTNADSYP